MKDQDIEEVKGFKTKDGETFYNKMKAEKHNHGLKIQKMKGDFTEYAIDLLKDILETDTEDGYYGGFIEGDYADGILSFDDIDDVVDGAMTIVDLWDGKFLKLIKHVEKESKKV